MKKKSSWKEKNPIQKTVTERQRLHAQLENILSNQLSEDSTKKDTQHF